MDSNLNITIRVNGRQAQQQLKAVSQQLAQAQNAAAKQMIGKSPTTAGASSPWSPAIAKRNAAAAAAAAKTAAAAQQKVLSQAWKRQTATARTASAQQTKVLTQAWNNQQRAHKASLNAQLQQQKVANAQALAQQKAAQKKMSKLGGLTPLGFAENLQKSKLVNAGKNINWVGRQLTYNFTLPLVAAGGALMKFGMDVERSTTELSKVYGDVTEDQGMLKKEIDELGKSFELLSTYFGINRTEVIDIAAAWAAAGSAGSGLAENTKATIETMILGDMDAQKATEGLIAIQAQWNFSTKKNADGVSELTLQLAHLNSIENATGISTEGLIEIIQRSGGTARNSGLEFRELAALASALVPATGDAAQAGTALRSIMSSLMAPTAQATEALKLMGITVTDKEFMGQDVMGRLQVVAEHFNKLSDAQRGVVSSTIATKWQVSRFDVLMRQISDPLSFFNKALEVTSDDTRSLETRQRELQTVLQSNPKKFDIMTNAMKNALTDAFIPLIPAIMSVVKFIMDLVVAFTNLDPSIQKFIMLAAVAIAVLGPVMSLVGSTMQLIGVFSSALKPAGAAVWWFISKALFPLIEALMTTGAAFVETAVTAVGAWMAGFLPLWAIVAIIAAIVAAIILILDDDLRGQIWEIIKDIARAIGELPGVFAKVFTNLIRVVGAAVAKVAEALSYLNPFARHSPSLVDNVRKGVSTILDEYSRLNQIPNLVRSAAAALEAFSTATSASGQTAREIELRKSANVEGASPAQSAAANSLVDNIMSLERSLKPLESQINAQEAIVDDWTAALKNADAVVKAHQTTLDALEKEYGKMGDAIATANQKISDLASTPIAGMGALEDQIFANQLAQDKLNMSLLEFEKQGYTLDSIADKYAAMAGEIETLRGTQEELRTAGAGSDILSWYDDQIAGIQAQKQEMGGVEQQIVDINKQLDALDLEGRFLDLTKAINFDPLERQIDQIANRVTEMPFDQIVAQIREQQTIVDTLEPQYAALGDQVEREKEALEAANLVRDGISDRLDAEKDKLDVLKDAYSDIKDLLQDMESALSGFASAMKEITDNSSRLEDLFAAGEGVNFEDFGGNAPLGREGALADIQAFNEEMDRLLQEAMQNMGEFDLMTPLKDAWEKAKNWLLDVPDKIKEIVKKWWPLIAAAVAVGLVGMFLGVPAMLIVVGGLLAGAFLFAFKDTILSWLKDNNNWTIVAAALGVAIVGVFLGAVPAAIVGVGLLFGALLAYGWNQKDNIWAFWSTIGWDAVKALASGFWQALQGVWDPILTDINELWAGIAAVPNFVDMGWDWIWGLKDGIWQAIQKLWDDILDNFRALWKGIKDFFGVNSPSTLFRDLGVDLILGLLQGLASMMEAVGGWFLGLGVAIWQWAYDNVVGKVINAITGLPDLVRGIFDKVWTAIQTVWGGIGAGLQLIWDTTISPIWDLFQEAFDTVVKPAFEFLRDNIIKPIMDTIYTAIKTVWNNIAGLIEGGVNFFVDAFNKIGDAVNAIANFLHLPDNWRIPDMNHIEVKRIADAPAAGGGGGSVKAMAAGGVAPIDRRGGAYNTPRAIVGEGSKIYPEFVIPTDPQYRNNALNYWKQAGSHLMAAGGQVPLSEAETLYDTVGSWTPPGVVQGEVGGGGGGGSSGSWGGGQDKGWMQRVMDVISSAGTAIFKGAVKLAWAGVRPAADLAVNHIPNEIFKGSARGILDTMDAWVSGRSEEWDTLASAFAPTTGQPGGGGNTGSGATAAGIPLTFGSGSWVAFTTLLNRMHIPYQNLGTYANRNTARTGNLSWHAMNRAMDFGGTQMQLQAIDHALYDAFKPYLHELIWTGPDSRNVFKGQDHTFRADIAGDHLTHVHASMAQGGRFTVPRIPGGVNVNVAEGRSGEQVQILPVDDGGSGGTTIVINGNLEFPNVTNGSDAKDFLQNLRALAS